MVLQMDIDVGNVFSFGGVEEHCFPSLESSLSVFVSCQFSFIVKSSRLWCQIHSLKNLKVVWSISVGTEDTIQYIFIISSEKFVYSGIRTIYTLIFTLDFNTHTCILTLNNYNNNSTVLEHEMRKIIAA